MIPLTRSLKKLQTASTKFRKQQSDGSDPVEFMRRYFDIYELLKRPSVQNFIGGKAYKAHKQTRFPTWRQSERR